MLTTFERLAKIVAKETDPANWVEAAFASIAGAVLPAVTSSDKNKVLTVNNSGKWVAKAPASQLPSVTSSDEGKVLTVNSSGVWDAETASGGLPAYTASDKNKVLTVVEGSGGAVSAEWVAASGGSPLVVNITLDEQTFANTMDKTWQEINSANGNVIMRRYFSSGNYSIVQLQSVEYTTGEITSYGINTIEYDSGDWVYTSYSASSATDYPTTGSGQSSPMT